MKPARDVRTKTRLAACLLAGLVILASACGSKPPKSALPETDREFEQTSQAARVAFENNRMQQAVALYRKALARAYVMDDVSAVVDTHYNLAVCHLSLEAYGEALEQTEKIHRELQWAGRNAPNSILLLEATARYKNGDLEEAWKITEGLVSGQPPPAPETLAEARYLRGRIAVDRGQADRVKVEISELGQPATPRFQADRLELIGRRAMLAEKWEDAASALDAAAALRAASGDYRSMAVLLAISAQACERARRLDAGAWRYLRAARSALFSGDKHRAAVWLQETVRLAGLAGADAILTEALHYQSIQIQSSDY